MAITHRHWRVSETPRGVELCYRPRDGEGFVPALVACLIFGAICIYGAAVFLRAWLLDGEEILVGGMVLFLLLVGGVYLAYCGVRHLYRTTTYILGGSSLRLTHSRWGRAAEEVIDRGFLRGIQQVHTPGEDRAQPDVWRTAITYGTPTGGEKRLYFEGSTEEECRELSQLLADWAKLKIVKESTVD